MLKQRLRLRSIGTDRARRLTYRLEGGFAALPPGGDLSEPGVLPDLANSRAGRDWREILLKIAHSSALGSQYISWF